jgi:peptidoglycan/LPS O-acetylase OafA/YrhL
LEPTVPTSRISSLDGWRGLAVILVLWGHFFPADHINLGTFGVELFFVLSGRLMAQILFLNEFPLPKFFFRRATRILPALIGFVGIYWFASSFLGEPYSLSPLWAIAAVTFTFNYLVLFTQSTGWFDHIWSLCVEEHAYFLLGGLVILFGRSVRMAIWVIGSLSLLMMLNGVVSSALLNQSYEMVYHRSDVHIASIFISVAVFLTLRNQMSAAWLNRLALPLFLAAVVSGVLLSVSSIDYAVTYTAGTTCLAVAVALVDVASKPIATAFSNPVLTRFGLWSYSIYLWQQPFYKLDEMFPGYTVCLLLAAILCGIGSYYLIEKPSRRWLNAIWPAIETRLSQRSSKVSEGRLPRRSGKTEE